MSLGLSGQNWLIASSRIEDWWKSQLSISMLVLMFAVLFTLFPKRTKNSDDYSGVSLGWYENYFHDYSTFNKWHNEELSLVKNRRKFIVE